MLNLSKEDVGLVLCALKDAKKYNEHLLDGGDLETDDVEECKIAIVDYAAMYDKIKQQW